MALTKAQISLVTVATLGAAPGGFTADLANLGSQKEVANLIASLGTPEFTTLTNAEFVNNVAKNLGTTVQAKDKIAFLKALEDGTSRADAAVDFANLQLVEHGTIANVNKAAASTSTSTDLGALKAEVTPVDNSLTIDLTKGTAGPDTTTTNTNGSTNGSTNGNTDTATGNSSSNSNSQSNSNSTSVTTPSNTFTTSNIGKKEIDAGTPKKSADYTFELKNQIGENQTFKANFLSPVLDRKAADTTGSQIVLELRNLREENDSVEPLKGLKVDGIAFYLNGKILKVASEKVNEALTYEALRTAIEERIEELVAGDPAKMPTGSDGESTNPADYKALATFTVSLGTVDFSVTNDSGDLVTGKQIVLTDSAGQDITPITTTDAPGLVIGTGFTLYGELKDKPATDVAKLISTNLDADNVGYGSQGANLNIAGQSASNKGIEELKINASNGVWFGQLQSKKATDHLQQIELNGSGYFNVGTQNKESVVSLVKQNFNAGGLKDVQQVNASNFAGTTAINSFVSSNVLTRHDFKDTDKFQEDDKDALISYKLSGDKDVLNLAISTKVLAAVDTKVNVSTGAGDDVITVFATNDYGSNSYVSAATNGGSWLVNQQLNNNIVIDAGNGNDWILTPGAGNATINAGAGNDVVRVDNEGKKAVFVFNAETTNINTLKTTEGLTSNSNAANSSGANGEDQTFNFFKAVVKVTFKGFESKYITIDSSTSNYTTNTQQINQAIKEAINTDPVLKNLITAHDNDGNALAIESQIDGKLSLDDLKIEIQGAADYSTAEADIKAAKAAGKVMLGKDDATKAKAVYDAAATTAAANTDAAQNLYDTVFGTTGVAGPNPYTTAPTLVDGTTYAAGTDGVATLTIAAANTAIGTVSVGGLEIALGTNANEAATAADIATKLNAITDKTKTILFDGKAVPLSAITIAASGATVTFDVNAAWMKDNAMAAVTAGFPALAIVTGATSVAGTSAATTAGTPTTPETNTFTIAGAADEAGVLKFGNIEVEVAKGATATDVGDLIVTALNGQTFNGHKVAVSNSSGTVTIEYPAAAGDMGAGTFTQIGAGIIKEAGINSVAESDNVINLGSGDDLLVLGTGTESNDTIKIDGTNQGTNTIVNFEVTGTGKDFLDFSAYLTSKDATTKALIAKGVNTSTFADNNVTIVDFTTDNTLDKDATAKKYLAFSDLTDANITALLNNTKSDGTITGMKGDLTLDASNHVLMVHSNTNAGEYKAFQVTTGANSVTATVKLIGTFDFGADDTGTSNLANFDATNLA